MVTQENHYDPWGVAIEQEVVADKTKLPSFELKDRFTYNGKELQGTLNYLDYGARMYDATIGRWGVVDPLAEKMQSWSIYHFTFNNPIKYIDYNGLIPMPVNKLFKGMVHRIDSWFGPRNTGIKGASKFHRGIDINFGSGTADKGAPVLTTHDGVATIDNDPSGKEGRMVTVTSPDGKFRTKYLHLSKINFGNKEDVNEASQIGEIGGSGYGSETGQQTHLHYSIERFNEETGKFEAYNPTEGKRKK